MKKITIILCYTKENSIWAINYIKKNPNEKVIVLTPTIEGQLIIKKAGIPYLYWYEVEEYEQEFLTELRNEPHQKSQEVIALFEKEVSLHSQRLNNVNIFLVLRDGLNSIFNDIIHNYKIYRKIINKWNPQKIYSPHLYKKYYKTGEGNFFSLAFYIQYYFKSTKEINHFYHSKKEKKNYIKVTLSNFINLFFFTKYSIQKLFFLIENIRIQSKHIDVKYDLLMETGGIITSYYYDFYNLIGKQYNLLLVTYKLQLNQQLPLLKRKIHHINLNSLWNNNDNDLLNSESNRIINSFTKIKNIGSHNKISWVNKDLNMAFVDQTTIYLKTNIKNALKKIIINTNLLKKYKPAIIINSHDPSPTGLSLVLPARIKSIPSVLLLHGLPIGKHHAKIYSDYLITWGKKTQETFENYSNLKKTNILSSGLPLLDRYAKYFNNPKYKSIKIRSISDIKLGILLTNYHPNDSYIAKFLMELISAFNNSGITINYRLHEGYNISGIKLLERESGCKFYNKSTENIEDFVVKNDVILSFDTTAILWPMIFKKPLFYTSPIWGKGSLPIDKYNAAWIPKNAVELLEKLKEFISSPSIYNELLPGQSKFLHDFAGPVNGKSSKKLVKIINTLLKNTTI